VTGEEECDPQPAKIRRSEKRAVRRMANILVTSNQQTVRHSFRITENATFCVAQ